MARNLSIDLKSLRSIPPAAKYTIPILMPLIIGVLFLFLYYKPKTEEIKQLKDEVTKQEQEIAKMAAELGKLPEMKAKFETALGEFEKLKQQLPEEKEVSNLLKQVSDLGIQAGLNTRFWKPGERTTHTSNIVYEIPVKVEMIGSYHSLGAFFSSLTELDRIVNVANIKMGGAEPSEKVATLKISFDAFTFSSIPEEEQKKEKEKPKPEKSSSIPEEE